MLIENIMHSPVITIEPGQSIAQALAITQDNNIRHLPVVENGKLVGILSDRDLRDACPSTLESNPAGVLANTPVSKIMHSKVITLHPLDFFDEAVRLFYEHKISSLPVVSNGLVVGIVTETDVLNHLVGMLGILSPGSYLEVEIPDRPGVLAEITQIIKNHGVNVSSVLLCPGRNDANKCLVFRIQALNISKIVTEIEGLGYRILWPVPIGG